MTRWLAKVCRRTCHPIRRSLEPPSRSTTIGAAGKTGDPMKNSLWLRMSMLQAAVLALGSAGQARAQAMVVESSGGPVTKTEREAFKAFMLTRVPPPNAWGDTGQHNALADGTAGTDVEAMGQMFEATGDVEILDRMIFFLDEFVALRNDLPGGAHRVVWTGKVEKVWLGAVDTVAPGGENSDTIAHIAYGALLILRTPALWPRVVPDGNPH